MKIQKIVEMTAFLEPGDEICEEHNLVKYGENVYSSFIPIAESRTGKVLLKEVQDFRIPQNAKFVKYKS